MLHLVSAFIYKFYEKYCTTLNATIKLSCNILGQINDGTSEYESVDLKGMNSIGYVFFNLALFTANFWTLSVVINVV